jgi:membrane associated rhomboid family serine protease
MGGGGAFGGGQQMGPRLTPGVKWILIAIFVGFVLQLSRLWQLVTYPFLHGGVAHLFFNGLFLYMVGTELEGRWGTRRFLAYYALCALGGALLHTFIWLVSILFFPSYAEALGVQPIVGASGGIYGLLMAFGLLFGNAMILVMFVLPMKAKHFVMAAAGYELVMSVFYGDPRLGGGVAHLVHLGGLATGFLMLWFRGKNLDGRGGGGGFGRRKVMDADEMRRRLKVVVNNDTANNKYPITWN